MYYYGYFRSNDTSNDPNGQLYKVVIITDFLNLDTTTVKSLELLLADSPFIVEYATEDNNLFKPYKCSTATVSFYLENLNYDFISSTGDDVFVQLLKRKGLKDDSADNINTDAKLYDVEWVGFATPNTYSQSFNSIIDLFQLECLDAFSILKYYDYQKTSDTIVKFSDILLKYVQILSSYKHIYISNHIKINQYEKDETAFNICSILNRNFFDEDNQPEKVIDIFENIFRYFNVSCVPYKDSLYIINYKSIIEDYNEYRHYYIPKSNFAFYKDKEYIDGGYIQLNADYDIKKNDFASDDTTVSFVGTFNKVKVKDDMYTSDLQLVDLSDISNVVYNDVYGYNYNIDNVKEKGSIAYIVSKEPNGTTIIDKVQFHVYHRDVITGVPTLVTVKNLLDGTLDYEDVSSQYFNYNENKITSSITTAYNMSCYIQYDSQKVDDLETADPVFSYKKCYAIFQPPAITKLDEKWVESPHILREQYENGGQPMIDFIGENFTYMPNSYLMISGSFYQYPDTKGMPIESTWTTGPCAPNFERLWASLNIGGLWWNGSEWVNTETRFNLPRDLDNKKTYFSDKRISDTNKGSYGIDGSGYVVPLPDTLNVQSLAFKFTIYRPYSINATTPVNTAYRDFITLIKDFDIKIIHGDVISLIFGEDDSDTEYEATVVSGAVEDYDDIDQKITTWDNKKINYSSVMYDDYFINGDNMEKSKDYLAVYHDKATGEICCAEEHIINSICGEYKQPKIMFLATLHKMFYPYSMITYHYFADYTDYYNLVIDGQSIDYAYNTNTITAVLVYKDSFTDNDWDKSVNWLKWYQTNFKELIQQFNKQRDYYRNGSIVKDSKIKTFGEKPITSLFLSYDFPEARFSITDDNLCFDIVSDVIQYTDGEKKKTTFSKPQNRARTNNLTILQVIPWAFISPYFDTTTHEMRLYVPNAIYRSVVYKIDDNGNLKVGNYGSL